MLASQVNILVLYTFKKALQTKLGSKSWRIALYTNVLNILRLCLHLVSIFYNICLYYSFVFFFYLKCAQTGKVDQTLVTIYKTHLRYFATIIFYWSRPPAETRREY